MGLVGTGTIGASLLGMLADQREVLRTQFHLDVQIRAVANADKVSQAIAVLIFCARTCYCVAYLSTYEMKVD